MILWMRAHRIASLLLPAVASAALLAAGLQAVPLTAAGAAPGRVDLAPVGKAGLRAADVALGRGLSRLETDRFSMVAVTWRGEAPSVDVRVRHETGWSGWRELEPLGDGADAPEVTPVRGTDLLWVGDARDVQTRVAGHARDLTLVLMEPTARPEDTGGSATTSTAATTAPSGAVTRTASLRTSRLTTDVPRPRIRTRKRWGADESWRNSPPRYIRTIKQVHVHHTVNSNGYRRGEVPGLIRGMYRYHTQNLGWSDIGYNFLVDKFGRAWMGRAGGAKRRVRGAHTLGFNHRSTGIAVIGNFEDRRPPRRVLGTMGRLSAWKLDMDGRNPRSRTWVTSEGSDKYPSGRRVRLRVIDGHRDTNDTACPGQRLYDKLPAIRRRAARVINRSTAG